MLKLNKSMHGQDKGSVCATDSHSTNDTDDSRSYNRHIMKTISTSSSKDSYSIWRTFYKGIFSILVRFFLRDSNLG